MKIIRFRETINCYGKFSPNNFTWWDLVPDPYLILDQDLIFKAWFIWVTGKATVTLNSIFVWFEFLRDLLYSICIVLQLLLFLEQNACAFWYQCVDLFIAGLIYTYFLHCSRATNHHSPPLTFLFLPQHHWSWLGLCDCSGRYILLI